ncbi:protein of unknown function [Paenibacillus sp. RU4T]|uniref:DUF1871 family protein n=1 Tax=unclassified Paenibacillus TaxID=185978 RepID=UPI000956E315|nr:MULTISPECIES: DUF1871 family protein [unclassified Paenibacillus]SIR28340.1 protein of unknown function [Paenibacillus sp. RU4X]SIR40673.1 protein of unknown function [Paenibacillus sp. RU4T]
MFELIRDVVNEWDPFNLLRSYCCPPDEYKHEIRAIVCHIHDNITAEELSFRISAIFSNHFGENEKCKGTLRVAQKIIEALRQQDLLPRRRPGSMPYNPLSSQ